ncbi:hypothetical protein [Myxacorys almedinensis]|uniref:Uncharacterized protein n=1 Tax=Myxacorys almedinensis A TaxID=2690445 RepID=A0A8J7YXH7_9CYAN|nr:hypothetical protein [Myxacorys almedinensis]NDJ15969.1 hypothetical protein [Myxacorys almedinensis A]
MRRQPISKGFSAGLQVWLLFLITLFGIGYPALLSIALGALGGLASGLIVDWWLSKDEKTAPDPRPLPEEGTEEMTRNRRRRRENSALRHRQQRKRSRSFDWRFFRRDKDNS